MKKRKKTLDFSAATQTPNLTLLLVNTSLEAESHFFKLFFSSIGQSNYYKYFVLQKTLCVKMNN